MKKNIVLLILLMSLWAFPVFGVTCEYSEKHRLNTEASHIKINYEVKTGVFNDPRLGCDGEGDECHLEYDYLEVSILNMTDDFYVDITNNVNSDHLIMYPADMDENGIIKFNHNYVMDKATYTLKFFASTKSSCAGQLIKTYTKALPRKNMNAEEAICHDIPDADICQTFVFFDEMEYSKFYKVATEEKAKKEEAEARKKKEEKGNFFDKAIDFVIENKWWFIGGCVLVVGAGAVITITRKKDQ